MEQYKDFAFVYDELMNEVDYNGWVKYIEDIIKNENAQVKNILELACGTGNLTIPLTKKNYDIAGIDISDEMLSVAREKAEKEGRYFGSREFRTKQRRRDKCLNPTPLNSSFFPKSPKQKSKR